MLIATASPPCALPPDAALPDAEVLLEPDGAGLELGAAPAVVSEPAATLPLLAPAYPRLSILVVKLIVMVMGA